MVAQSAENVCIIRSPHGQSQLFIHCLPTFSFWVYAERCQYGCRVSQVPVYISFFTPPLSCTAIADQNDLNARLTSPCTTVTFSHDKITDEMNYKVIFCFLWWPQLMWLEGLGLAGSLFRVGSVNDSLEIRRPAATANTPRCDSSQTTQLVCTCN